MELRHYWNVIWKRRRLVLAIVLLVTVISGLMALTAKRSYEAEARFITRQDPSPDQVSQYFTFDRYYNWFSSEFLVDDYTQVVTSDAFAAATLDVLHQNVDQNILARPDYGSLTPQAIQEAREAINKLGPENVKAMMETDRKHRVLSIVVTASPKVVAKALSDAAATVLADARMRPIQGPQIDDRALFSQIDYANMIEIQSSTSKEIISAILRVIIGIVVALALAFLLEYLDNSVRDERDARRVLDLPVVGTIPRT
jgi:capsular polysaccharide biosynthesis protein